MSKDNVTYTLITVTRDGAVHVQEDIKSKEMADEAAFIALHGRTTEDQKAYDKWLKDYLEKHDSLLTHEDSITCKFAKVFEVRNQS